MSKEGYNIEKRDGDNKVVLEKLQSYLKDKRSGESSEFGSSYNKTAVGLEHPDALHNFEEGSNILRDVLNFKKAALFRDPEIIEILKTLSHSLKQNK